jgi:hypothetical protein
VSTPEDQLRLEVQLRDAYQAAARTVQPGSVRGLPDFGDLGEPGGRAAQGEPTGPGSGGGWAGHDGRDARRRRLRAARLGGRRIGVPAAAAAVVAIIVLAVTVVVPRLLAGRPVGGTAGPAAAAGEPPRFYAAVKTAAQKTDAQSRVIGATVLDIISTATGRVVSQVPAPGPGVDFRVVTAVKSDQSFVAAAEPLKGARGGCVSSLYRFRLTAQGQPADVTPLAEVHGVVPLNQLAASADGRVIAYVRTGCGANLGRGQLVVAHLDGGQISRQSWSQTDSFVPLSLSLSARGRLLSIMADKIGKSGRPLAGAWIMRADARPGPLARRVRRVITPSVSLLAAALSQGARKIVGEFYYQSDTAVTFDLELFGTGAGATQRTKALGFPSARLLSPPAGTPVASLFQGVQTFIPATTKRRHSFMAVDTASGISLDGSGRYALMFDWQAQSAFLDLATGRLTDLPAPASSGRVWSAAW